MQVKSGREYEGIFHSAGTDATSLNVVLKMARLVADSKISGPLPVTKPAPTLIVASADVVDMYALDVRMGATDVGPRVSAEDDDAGGFGTDSAISRGRGGGLSGRELQPWLPDASIEMTTLEESVRGTKSGWDQFALNEKQFGVTTDYKEDFYTTEYNPQKSKISVAEAARIAAEIERGDHSTIKNTFHVLEERGMEIGDVDEEARYGAVIRDVPPAKPSHPMGAWSRGRPGGTAPQTAPIAIDPRKEANRVRAQMTEPKRSSPYGTPKGLSTSPLVSDPKFIEAMNLDPGTSKFDDETRQSFQEFKLREKGGKDSGAGKTMVNELKQFSATLDTRMSKSASGGISGLEEQSTLAPSEKSDISSNTTTSTAKKGLNPFAKEFTFNINAKEFDPGAAKVGSSEGFTAPGTVSVKAPEDYRQRQIRQDDRKGPRPPPPPPPTDAGSRSPPGAMIPGGWMMPGMMMGPGGPQAGGYPGYMIAAPAPMMMPPAPRPGMPYMLPNPMTGSPGRTIPMSMPTGAMMMPTGAMMMPMPPPSRNDE